MFRNTGHVFYRLRLFDIEYGFLCFIHLILFAAKLPARSFLAPAKGGCLPPPDSCLEENVFLVLFKLVFCQTVFRGIARSGFPLLAGGKKTHEPLVKSSKKDQADEIHIQRRGPPFILSAAAKKLFHPGLACPEDAGTALGKTLCPTTKKISKTTGKKGMRTRPRNRCPKNRP